MGHHHSNLFTRCSYVSNWVVTEIEGYNLVKYPMGYFCTLFK